jgi:prephenate dehydrogenase
MMEQFEVFFAELKGEIAAGDGDKLFEFFLRSKQMRDAIL